MDEVVLVEVLEKICGFIVEYGEGVLEVYDLRICIVGKLIFIDFYLVVLGFMIVEVVYDICDCIEMVICEDVFGVCIIIYVELEYKVKYVGIVVL